MWNRPAPYIDDSNDSATRPFSSAETPAQQPARVRSSLRRALRVLIPTVVAGAGGYRVSPAASGHPMPRVWSDAHTRARTANPRTRQPARTTSDIGLLSIQRRAG